MLAPVIRHFSPADLNSSAGWLMARLRTRYPHKSEIMLANWLRVLSNRNDCLFIRTDWAVALAEVVVLDLMDEHPVVYERFVWCRDRQNINHVEQATSLYEELRHWAKSMSVEKVIINQSSDVPKEKIKEVFKKLHTEDVTFVRV